MLKNVLPVKDSTVQNKSGVGMFNCNNRMNGEVTNRTPGLCRIRRSWFLCMVKGCGAIVLMRMAVNNQLACKKA